MEDLKTGITDIEIHFLQIKFTAIGVYLEPEIVGHLQQYKGKQGSELAEDDDFFEAVISGKKNYSTFLIRSNYKQVEKNSGYLLPIYMYMQLLWRNS